MTPVKMYTTAVCPYCVRAKQILIDLSSEQRDHMMNLTGRRTVPQIFIGDHHVGGCDDLIALDSSGGLMPLLEAN